MCYHTNTSYENRQVEATMQRKVTWNKLPTNDQLKTSAHVHPEVPIILKTASDELIAESGVWGLIPKWARDREKQIELQAMTVNARIETLTEKTTFRDSISNRCLFPVAGFFEWHHAGKIVQPYYIYGSKDPILFLAGLYTRIQHAEKDILTFTALTTQANERMAYIHNKKRRMPVIIPVEKIDFYLNSSAPLHQFSAPLPTHYLSDHPIDPKKIMDKKFIKDPTILERYHETRPIQGSLF